MRDIPPEQWDAFLDAFTRQHRNERMTLEESDMQDGLRITASAAPLVNIAHNREKRSLSITFGEGASCNTTRTVRQADGIAVEEPAPGGDSRSALHLMGGGHHLVVTFGEPRREAFVHPAPSHGYRS